MKNKKNIHYHRVQHIPIGLDQIPNFVLNRQCLFFDNIYQKRMFSIQTRTNEYYYRNQNNRIRRDSNVHLKQRVLSFWIKIAQKVYFPSSARQVLVKNQSRYHFHLPSRGILGQYRNIQDYHRIQHIRINLNAKFYLKFGFFWPNSHKKGRKKILFMKDTIFQKFFVTMKYTY